MNFLLLGGSAENRRVSNQWSNYVCELRKARAMQLLREELASPRRYRGRPADWRARQPTAFKVHRTVGEPTVVIKGQAFGGRASRQRFEVHRTAGQPTRDHGPGWTKAPSMYQCTRGPTGGVYLTCRSR